MSYLLLYIVGWLLMSLTIFAFSWVVINLASTCCPDWWKGFIVDDLPEWALELD
ncbi:hypothetical protein QUF58_09010 [Anaerolineales bacterium HSG24]|nr:hypothetical protein [Anaerolineales bacterium HSG24]